MAFLTCHFFSTTLGSNVTLNATIPTVQGNHEIDSDDQQQKQLVPVVYLLHGMFGDVNSWMRFSSIERYAQARNCAVIMVSGANDFYQNVPHGAQYETFITRELPGFVCDLFPVSRKREDTFIAGFSMGGYGAWHLALAAPEVFSKAASMSGALDIARLYETGKGKPEGFIHWSRLLEDPEKITGSHSDLLSQFDECQQKGMVPELFQTCGLSDGLYADNVRFRDLLLSKGAKLTWTEGAGGHDWDFWDLHIQEILDWMLPAEKK